jgi:hypothetical protein
LFWIFSKERKEKSSRDSAQTLKSLEGNKRDGEQERCGEREREEIEEKGMGEESLNRACTSPPLH